MKRKFWIQIAVIPALVVWCLSGYAASEQTWEGAAAEVSEDAEVAEAQARETAALVEMDQERLSAELKALKEKLNAAQSVLDGRQKRLQSLLFQEDELRNALEAQQDEIRRIEDAVFTSASKARTLLDRSPATAEHPERLEALVPLLSKERFPGIEGIEAVVGVLLGEMRDSGDIVSREGSILTKEGREQEARVVRIGSICAVYRLPDGKTGYLDVQEEGTLAAIPGDPSWSVIGRLEDYLSGETDHLPVDISGGTVFKRITKEKSLGDWIRSGGILVWPIFAVGALALILALERLFYLLSIRSNSDRVMTFVRGLIQKGEYDKIRDYCTGNKRFPTCRVFAAALDHIGSSQEVIENSIQEGISAIVPRLERFLPTLAVLGAVAPLLGLLGTVTGMINTFQVITIFGTGDPKMMSGGISEALVTTQLGLAIAIPIILMHHFLERRVDKIVADIDEKGTAFSLEILKEGAIRGGCEAGVA